MNHQIHLSEPPPKSVLVIRLSSLGDVILTTPIVRQLQRSFPEAVIDVMVHDRFAEVYAFNPRVRTVWSAIGSTTLDGDLDARKAEMMESVPGGKYDLVVDLHHNLQTVAIRRGLGHSEVVYPKFRWQKLAMVWLKKFPATTTSVVDRYRTPLRHLPLVHDTEGSEVWLRTEKESGVYRPRREELPIHGVQSHHKHKAQLHVVIAPGAHHATKRWPVENVAALCSMFVENGATVSLLGSVADVQICDAIEQTAGVPIQRMDGATTLEQTITAIDSADILVTNDSGVMHLGAARRIPIVAIFGSTVRQLGFEPFGTRYVVVEHDVRCRPCSHIGRSSCPKGHFKCMVSISPQMVFDAAMKLLG